MAQKRSFLGGLPDGYTVNIPELNVVSSFVAGGGGTMAGATTGATGSTGEVPSRRPVRKNELAAPPPTHEFSPRQKPTPLPGAAAPSRAFQRGRNLFFPLSQSLSGMNCVASWSRSRKLGPNLCHIRTIRAVVFRWDTSR